MELTIDRPTSKNVGDATRRAMEAYIKDGLSAGFALSQNRAPEDRGQLRRSGFPPEKRSDGSIVTGYTAPYAEAQEKGTEPYQPPRKPLVEWAERVFGNPAIGYAVANKIAEEGIEPKGFLSDGAKEAKAWFRRNDPDRYLEREL